MSHDQQVTRDAVTGQYESPKNKGPEDYTTTEEHLSPWQKEWRRIGERAEQLLQHESLMGESRDQALDTLAVQAVIHIQMLKRPTPSDFTAQDAAIEEGKMDAEG